MTEKKLLRTAAKRQAAYPTLLALLTIVVIVSWIIFLIAADERQKHLVTQAQQEMIAHVQEAHLLGGTKQNALSFFRQQKMPSGELYRSLEGDGWEVFLSNKILPSTLGKTIYGSTGVIAQTTGYFGCKRNWSIQTIVLFDAKGKVIGVEVSPTFYGCDI